MRQLRIALTLHYNLFQFNSAHYSLSCPLFSMAVSLILTHVFHGNAKPINETLRLQRSSMLLHESQAAKKRVNNVCLLCSIFFSFYFILCSFICAFSSAYRTLTLNYIGSVHAVESHHVYPPRHLQRYRVGHHWGVFIQPVNAFGECFPVMGRFG